MPHPRATPTAALARRRRRATWAEVVIRDVMDDVAVRRVFRILVDALSSPGEVFQLPRTIVQRVPAAVVPLLVMTDNDIPIALHPDPHGWTTAVSLATGAPPSELADAETVAFLEAPAGSVLRTLDPGSVYSPERGTRVMITVDSLGVIDAADPTPYGGTRVRLSGPGVHGQRHLAVGGVDGTLFASLAGVNTAFPAGLDVWLLTPAGAVAALARSTQISTGADREP